MSILFPGYTGSIFYFKSAGHDDKLIIDPKAIINRAPLFFISTVISSHNGKKSHANFPLRREQSRIHRF